MDLRGDIYPDLGDGITWSREGKLKERIEKAMISLDRFFESEKDIIEYVNGFETPEDAELFLNICRFYYYSKLDNELGFYKFIMFISVLEKASNRNYKTFVEWIKSGEDKNKIKEKLDEITEVEFAEFKELIDDLHEEYLKSYGARRNLKEFLWNNLTKDEKIDIIRSFRTKKKKHVSPVSPKIASKYDSLEKCAEEEMVTPQEAILPRCFHWQRCYLGMSTCDPGVNCILLEDKERLEHEFNYITQILYCYRSDFAHNTRVPPFSHDEDVSFMFDIYEGDLIIIEMNLKDFEELIDKALKRFFDSLQKNEGCVNTYERN